MAAVAARRVCGRPLHGRAAEASLGLQGVIRGKPVRTTISDKTAVCPLDHVNGMFHAPRPNALWVSDFTYVATWTGFIYVAFIIDAYARRIVGWRVSRTATRASCSMRWSRPFMIGGPSIVAGSCTTATAVAKADSSGRRNTNCFSLMTTTRQAPLLAFSSPGSFSVGH